MSQPIYKVRFKSIRTTTRLSGARVTDIEGPTEEMTVLAGCAERAIAEVRKKFDRPDIGDGYSNLVSKVISVEMIGRLDD
jgi:hypothetical protein